MNKTVISVGCGIALLLATLVVAFWHIGARDEGACRSDRGPPRRPARGIPGGGARALGLGGNRSCAVMTDGSVWCWGDDQRDPDAATRPLLTEALNQGRYHGTGYGCLLDKGAVTCWDGAQQAAAPSERDFVTLWVGSHSSCGKHAGKGVECWGVGRPWLSEDNEPLAPSHYEGLRGVDDLVIREGEIWVRFKQRVGRIDRGRALDGLREGPLSDEILGPLEVIDCHAVHCTRAQTGEVACWSGAEHSLKVKARFHVAASLTVANGQLCGKERTGAETCESCDTLLEAPQPDTASADTSCRIEPLGTVTCDGEFVPEGNGLLLPRLGHVSAPARRLAGVTDALKVIIDPTQVCVQQKSSGWQCMPLWPEGRANAQRGEGDWQVAAAPDRVPEAANAESVAVNRFALCFTNAQHTATCYRRGADGALRDRLVLPAVRKIVVGSAHACAIGEDATLSCWGANESGQALGKPNPGNVPVPSPVLKGVVDVALGLRQTCAVTRDRGVVCFGDNAQGQLGDAAADAAGLRAISGISSASKQVVLGFSDACALGAAGTVTCWGGLDKEQKPHPAAAVTGLGSPVLQLAAGGDRICALLADHSVSCWQGYGAPPSEVPGTRDSAELALGDEHACVRSGSGKVRCWGSNEFGQAGLAIRVTRSEIALQHACPQVNYELQQRVVAAEDVEW